MEWNAMQAINSKWDFQRKTNPKIDGDGDDLWACGTGIARTSESWRQPFIRNERSATVLYWRPFVFVNGSCATNDTSALLNDFLEKNL